MEATALGVNRCDDWDESGRRCGGCASADVSSRTAGVPLVMPIVQIVAEGDKRRIIRGQLGRIPSMKNRKRNLAVGIIIAVLIAALAGGLFLFKARRTPPGLLVASTTKPGAQPPHVRGDPKAPVTLEEFGDFECIPCFILWPALRNLEHDYGEKLAVIFRNNPMPQHPKALDGARAAEAAGLQGKFWVMHDVLYLQRGEWTKAADPRSKFSEFARRMQLDVDRFNRDFQSEEVTKRLRDDHDRAAALGLDRTPVVFINGRRAQLQGDVEKGLHDDIEAALTR
jgi:protein-disulfide isomerase